MKRNNYNRLEKQIAYKIKYLQDRKRFYFNRWHDVDARQAILKSKLGSKFVERKVMVPHLLTKESLLIAKFK